MKNKLKTIKIGLSIIAIAGILVAICSLEPTIEKQTEVISDSLKANHQDQIFDSITPTQQAEFDSIIKSENL